jgi:hypothetical protein
MLRWIAWLISQQYVVQVAVVSVAGRGVVAGEAKQGHEGGRRSTYAQNEY